MFPRPLLQGRRTGLEVGGGRLVDVVGEGAEPIPDKPGGSVVEVWDGGAHRT